jgi:DNA-binding transcriptional LysR family regulator
LSCGQADLALGVVMDDNTKTGLQREALGTVDFVFAVAPHHPLARRPEPLSDSVLRQHRAVAIADSVQHGASVSLGLLTGQDVFTVDNMTAKLDAQVRGLGIGFLPLCLAQPQVDSGHLIIKQVERAQQQIRSSYAWRSRGNGEQSGQGRALQWWLAQLRSPVTRAALLGQR